jgi:hypothetical protein
MGNVFCCGAFSVQAHANATNITEIIFFITYQIYFSGAKIQQKSLMQFICGTLRLVKLKTLIIEIED